MTHKCHRVSTAPCMNTLSGSPVWGEFPKCFQSPMTSALRTASGAQATHHRGSCHLAPGRILKLLHHAVPPSAGGPAETTEAQATA
jgi:hypothetical protein